MISRHVLRFTGAELRWWSPQPDGWQLSLGVHVEHRGRESTVDIDLLFWRVSLWWMRP